MNDIEASNSNNLVELTSVAVSGVSEDSTGQIESFIRALVSGTRELVADLALPTPVRLNVLCSTEFEATVDRIRKEYGHRVTGPYQAAKNAVESAGITLHTRDRNPPEFTIVLNAKACDAESNVDITRRYYLIAHEFGHVLIEAQLLGDEVPRDLHRATSIAQNLANMAEILLDEIKADRIANWACGLVLRRSDGGPVSLADELGFPLIASAADLLQEICRFVVSGIQHYRVTSLGLEQLLPRANSLVSESLLVLTHVVALYEAESRLDDLRNILTQIPGFSVYLQDCWPDFVAALTGESETNRQSKLSAVFVQVMAHVGLRVEELQTGSCFVHVHEPRFCTDSAHV